jgi:hypothetical protein
MIQIGQSGGGGAIDRTPPRERRPLGIRPEVQLTPAQECALKVLQDFDLTPLRDRLLRATMMPSGWVDEAILEFRRYMALELFEDGLTLFSKPVDTVWHTFLLFTRLYMEFCNTIFGYYIHHDPWLETKSAAARKPLLKQFVDAYERLYGPPGRMWHIDA